MTFGNQMTELGIEFLELNAFSYNQLSKSRAYVTLLVRV
jgi:hypothetical protein